MGSGPVVGVVTAVASASSAATPPSPGNTCPSARTNSQIKDSDFGSGSGARRSTMDAVYWRARARLGLPLSSLELTHARPPSSATVDAVLSLLVDECPGAQNEEAPGAGRASNGGPQSTFMVSIYPYHVYGVAGPVTGGDTGPRGRSARACRIGYDMRG